MLVICDGFFHTELWRFEFRNVVLYEGWLSVATGSFALNCGGLERKKIVVFKGGVVWPCGWSFLKVGWSVPVGGVVVFPCGWSFIKVGWSGPVGGLL